MKNVIIIAPHPDDETLGCGGTLLKHKQAGDNIAWVIVTNILPKYGFKKEIIANRQKEIKKVTQAYKFKKLYMLNYPVAYLDVVPKKELIVKIGNIFNEFQPNIVYLPNRSDIHSDHFVTYSTGMACTKSFRFPFVERVLMYECISETEFEPALQENMFVPNYFIDVTDFLEKKIQIMSIYASELRDHPFPRNSENIKALALNRGAIISVKYAEAFQLLKYVG